MISNKRQLNLQACMIIIWFTHFFVDMLIGFLAVYKTMAYLDLAIAGLIAGFCPFIGEGMQYFFGYFGDKGFRKICLLFGLMATVANAFLGYTHSYLLLFILYFLTCIGSGAFHPTACAIVSSLTEKKKGLYITFFASGGALGLGFSQIIFSSWYYYSQRTIALLAIPSILMILLLLFFNLAGYNTTPKKNTGKFSFLTIKKLFSFPELRILYIAQVCNQAVFWAVVFLLPDVLSSKGYEPWLSFGFGHLMYILGGALMMIPGGYLSEKFSARSVLLFSTIAGIIFFYLFLLSPVLSTPLLSAFLLIVGAALGVANPVSIAFGNRLMPKHPGMVSAFLMGMVWCISEFIGPGLGGFFTTFFVEDAPTKALAMIGSLFIISLRFIIMLPKGESKEIDLEYV